MIDLVHRVIVPASLSLLPSEMDSRPARALLLAIGLQESRFLHRRQVRGPARGYWQFEAGGGVRGVLRHRATAAHAQRILAALRYGPDPPVEAVHAALEHNDILACVFARLLLWTTPGVLPNETAPDLAWQTYVSAWRPGKPHPETWAAFYEEAWERVGVPDVHA